MGGGWLPNAAVRPHITSLMNIADVAQRSLTRAGAKCSPRLLWMLDGAVNYLYTGHWFGSRGLSARKFVADRTAIFEVAAQEIADSVVLYLEFGVFYGETMRVWSRLLRNPESKLHGFDSFEGLPETWNPMHRRGQFSLNGTMPRIDDPRVVFFKGWFQETLSRYSLPPHEKLVVSIDCDLYSSAKTVLDFLRPHWQPGTYLYFDEFNHREHEMKAFQEFGEDVRRNFRVAAANRQFSHVLFQCVP